MSSIRIDTPSDAFGAESGKTGVPVTVDRSATSGFVPSKSDYNVGPTFEVSRPVRYLHLLANRGCRIDYYLAEGHDYHSLKT